MWVHPLSKAAESLVGLSSLLFFFNDTATTEIYTLSLHDALPIYFHFERGGDAVHGFVAVKAIGRSEEHTSELQSLRHLVCRLLREKKKKSKHNTIKLIASIASPHIESRLQDV